MRPDTEAVIDPLTASVASDPSSATTNQKNHRSEEPARPDLEPLPVSLSRSGAAMPYHPSTANTGDGMAVDQQGNLYIAAGITRPRGPHETADIPPGIWIVTPEGELKGRIPIPEDVLTNVTFGGDDLRTMYVVSGKTLFSIRINTPGFVVHRKS